MASRSSTLVWRIPWTEERGRLQSMGHKRVGHNLATEQQQYIYMGILFHILFHYRLLQDTDDSSLFYTVGPSAHFVYGSVYLLIPKA